MSQHPFRYFATPPDIIRAAVMMHILFPGEGSGAFAFQGHLEAVLVRPRSNAVYVDGKSHEVLLKTDGRDLSLHQRIGEAADPLHFGYFGGLMTKLIWFVFGAALTTLSITGSAIYALRIMRARKERKSLGRGTLLALRAPGWWAWPTGGLVMLGCGLMAASLIGAG